MRALVRKHLSVFITLLAVFLALVMSNSTLHTTYHSIHEFTVSVGFGDWVFKKKIDHLVNEGLMAIFFFAMTLEIRKEIVFGSLNTAKAAAAPVLAAMGGVVFPAVIYYLICQQDVLLLKGWAIPIATDIIFALFAFDLLVKVDAKTKAILRIFLLSIAVVDDIVGVAVIAFFYTKELSSYYLLMTAVVISFIAILKQFKFLQRSLYVSLGFLLWITILQSGVHATMAGVILAIFMPFSCQEELSAVEKSLGPIIIYMIVPLFAFFNAGIELTGLNLYSLHPVFMGVFLGLWIGKPAGIILTTCAFERLKVIQLPENLSFDNLVIIGCLAGIGFTVSLFIGSLSFDQTTYFDEYMKLGIIYGSLLSAISASIWFKLRIKHAD
jgi:NhaA family Na+:H+ antiporter